MAAARAESAATLSARVAGARIAAEEVEEARTRAQADVAAASAKVEQIEEAAADKVAYLRAVMRQKEGKQSR